MILSKIIQEKKKVIEQAKKKLSLEELKQKVAKITVKSAFKRSISRPHHINLIAEMKKASPSRGIIRGDFNPLKIALTFEAQGASAISVITDERFFEGSLDYITKIKGHITIPVLRKDFIFDEYQIYESAYYGAEALLLIADILTPEELTRYLKLTKSIGMDALVEVHSEEDLQKAVKSGAVIIGINNRDLRTFSVDMNVTQRLAPLVPPNKVIVAESGIKTYEDVMFLKSIGVNAVLIGEAFMEADDIAAKIRDVMRY